MNSKDLSKKDLYESVKTLVESDISHIHLPQQKLFTLASVAFQYILYCSTKTPGAYIIRIEDSVLAEKLARKAKDLSTRKFIQRLLLPRRLKYDRSTFYLDFFHIGSWAITNEIPKEKIKGALIIKNTSSKPMQEAQFPEEEEVDPIMSSLPKDYFLTSLQEFVPKTITIAFDHQFEGTEQISFPFIKPKEEKLASGVRISSDVKWENFD